MIDTSLSTTAAPPPAPPLAADPSVPPADFMGLLLLLLGVGTTIPSPQGAAQYPALTPSDSAADPQGVVADDQSTPEDDRKARSSQPTATPGALQLLALLNPVPDGTAAPQPVVAVVPSGTDATPPAQPAAGAVADVTAPSSPTTPVGDQTPATAALSQIAPAALTSATPPASPVDPGLVVASAATPVTMATSKAELAQGQHAATAVPDDGADATAAASARPAAAAAPAPHGASTVSDARPVAPTVTAAQPVAPRVDPRTLPANVLFVSTADLGPRAATAAPRSTPVPRSSDDAPREAGTAVPPAPVRLLPFVVPGTAPVVPMRDDDDREPSQGTGPESHPAPAVLGEAARVLLSNDATQAKAAAVAEARPAATPAGAVVDPHVVDQVVRAARIVLRDGLTRMDVQLDPPSLGSVRVSAAVDGNSLGLSISAERPETRVLLAQAIPEIQAALSGRGFATASVAIAATFDPPDARRAPYRRDGDRSARGNHHPEERRRDARGDRSITTVDFTV